MTATEIESRIQHILTRRLGIPGTEIRSEASLVDDLGVDSIDMVELAIAVEKEFNISVAEEELQDVRLVKDVVATVERLVTAQLAG